MSITFECGKKTVWHPSPRVALAFVAQIRALEVFESDRTEKAVESGIGEVISNAVRVDPVALRKFVSLLTADLEVGISLAVGSLVCGPFALAAGILAACEPNGPRILGDSGPLARRGAAIVADCEPCGPIYEAMSERYFVRGDIFRTSIEKIRDALASEKWVLQVKENEVELKTEGSFIGIYTFDETGACTRDFFAVGELRGVPALAAEFMLSISTMLTTHGISANLQLDEPYGS